MFDLFFPKPRQYYGPTGNWIIFYLPRSVAVTAFFTTAMLAAHWFPARNFTGWSAIDDLIWGTPILVITIIVAFISLWITRLFCFILFMIVFALCNSLPILPPKR